MVGKHEWSEKRLKGRSRIPGLIFFVLFLFIFPATVFSLDKEQTIDRLVIRISYYYHQKHYEEAIFVASKVLEVAPYNQSVKDLLRQSYEKQIEAMIYAKQARLLYDNNQLLQAIESIDTAYTISPYTELISDFRERLYREQKNIRPLDGLSKEEKERFFEVLKKAKLSLGKGRNEDALKQFAEAISIAPRSPEAIEGYNLALVRTNQVANLARVQDLIKDADRLYRAKDYLNAKNAYEEVLMFDPANTVALARRRELDGLLKNAAERSEKEELAAKYLKTGNEFEDEKKYPEAIEQYQLGQGTLEDYRDWKKLIADAEAKYNRQKEEEYGRDIRDIQTIMETAIRQMITENFNGAIGSLERVIDLSNKTGQKTTAEEAEELIKKARENLKRKEEEELSPIVPYYKMVNSIKVMGINAFKQKDYSTARDHFSSILELFPKNRFARIYYLRSIIELDPGTKERVIDELIRDIESAEQKKDMIEVKRLVTIAIEVAPDDDKLRLIKEKFDEKKVDNVTGGPTVPRAQIEAWYQEALAMAGQEKRDDAVALLRRVLKADPAHAKARNLLLKMEGVYKPPQIREPNPQAQALYAEGMRHYENNRIREAKNAFEAALRIDPRHAQARSSLEKVNRYLQNTQ